MSDQAIQIVCRYRLKPENAERFEALLRGHWQLLNGLGLTSADPAKIEKATDQAGNVAYFERFAWKDRDAIDSAHESPEVMQLWEPMGSFCDDMEFWHLDVQG